MKTIRDTFALAKVEGDWGVEIEVEGKRLPQRIKGWRVEHDGSLKGEEAYEYVTPKPQSRKGVDEALKALEAAYKLNDSRVDESVRAGVHIHMNVQDYSVKEVFTFATLFFIVEPVLLKWCGENRDGNLFSLGTSHAEYQLFALQEALENKNWRALRTDNLRYAALNFQSLFKYGSLEFRSMRSTPDLNLIGDWVDILEELRDSAKKFSSPYDIMMSFSGEGEANFFRRVFPKHHAMLTFNGYEGLIRQAIRRVQMLAFTIDWDTFGTTITKNPFTAVEAM
jgi:hypothetical protein